ncbi:MAG: histidine kinase [Ginsengibacter sp.]
MTSYPFIFSKKYRLKRHFLFWFCWWAFESFLYSFAPLLANATVLNKFVVTSLDAFAYLVPHMFLAYTLMYFVVPVLLLRGRYLLTAAVVMLLFLVTAAISALIGVFLLHQVKLVLLPGLEILRTSFFLSLLAGLRGGITIGGLAAAIKLMKILYLKEQRNLQLQKENTESQLQLLKAQVHPHFLFNTLNNIYSYTQNVSPVASKLVLGLSDLLRSILYECNQEFIPVHQEIKMIKNYITLEKIRYGNKLDISANISGVQGELSIAPLLLLPFVENSFKHGTSQVIEQPWLNIYIGFNKDTMHMKLVNGKVCNDHAKSAAYPGIGLENVRHRLELLYPGRHILDIKDDVEVFIVDLKLKLIMAKPMSRNLSIKTGKIMTHG